MAIPVVKMLTVGLLPSPLKVFWYRSQGATIGKHVSIGMLSVLSAPKIEIGDDTKIGFLCFLSLKKKLKLGKRVSINSMVAVDTGEIEVDNDSIIMEQVIIGGMLSPRSKISIGKRVKIFPHSFLNPTYEIVIEDDVGIGGSNYIFTHGSWQNVLDGFQASFGPVHIKKNAWLPWRVFVLPGITIGESAIIGPGALVNQSVPDLGVASGLPAEVRDMQGRHIRKLTDKHKNKLMQSILKEYCEFQAYLDEDCQLVSIDDGDSILITHNQLKIIYSTETVDPTNTEADILISLSVLDDKQKQKLSDRDIVWFDLLAKEAKLSSIHQAVEIKNFLSRYGIRFDLID